jgi:hypothetical protein
VVPPPPNLPALQFQVEHLVVISGRSSSKLDNLFSAETELEKTFYRIAYWILGSVGPESVIGVVVATFL